MVRKFGFSLSVLLIGLSLALLNVLSFYRFDIWDISDSGLFTVSKTTKNILSNLDDRITVKLFLSGKLPAMYADMVSRVKDMLADFSSYSAGNIIVVREDPENVERFKAEADKYKIPSVRLDVKNQDRFEAINVYLGIVMLYRDRKVLLPVIDPSILRNLEYVLMVHIRRLITEKRKRVAFLTGHDEADFEKDLGMLVKSLRVNYEVVPYKIKEGQQIDERIDCLMVVGPKRDFSIWESFAVDQFLMSGKKAAFFIDTSIVKINEGFGHNLNTNLPDWLKAYGVEFEKNIVVDRKCIRIEIKQNSGDFSSTSSLDYPYFIEVNEFSPDSRISAGIQRVGLKFASSMKLSEYPGIRTEVLARTSRDSGVLQAPYFVGFEKKIPDSDFKSGPQVIAAVATGKFRSAFAGKHVTYRAEVDKSVDESGFQISKYSGKVVENSLENRLVFVGDGDLFSESIGVDRETIQFGLNIADWLNQSDDLIAIRSREVRNRRLKKIPGRYLPFFKYGNLFIPTLFIILMAILVKMIMLIHAGRIGRDFAQQEKLPKDR